MDYFVKPPTHRTDPADELMVHYHFTARRGVVAQLYNTGEDSLGIRVVMNDAAYPPAALPPNDDCSIPVSELSQLDSDIGSYIQWLIIGNGVVDPVAALIYERGVLTDCYESPIALSRTDSDIRAIELSSLARLPAATPNVNTALPVSSSEDNAQPFPIYGWADLEWIRHDTTPPIVHAPADATIPATEPAGTRWAVSRLLGAFLFGSSAVDAVDPAPANLWPQVGGQDVNPSQLFPLGTSQVAFGAKDASGNVGSATARVNVEIGRPRITVSKNFAVGSIPLACYMST